MNNFTTLLSNVTALAGVCLLVIGQPVAAQVGVGTTSPNAKAALDVQSSTNDKGLLIPRLTQAQRTAISSPPDGLMVFQTDNTTGFWYCFGGAWVNIPNANTAGDNLGNHTATANLNLSDKDVLLRGTAASSDAHHGLGWYGTGKLFNGLTVDGPALYGYAGGVLGTNQSGSRLAALYWNRAGNVGIGTASPGQLLQLGATTYGSSALLRLAAGNGSSFRAWDLGVQVDANSLGTTTGEYYDFALRDATANATRLLVEWNTGRVGIGTTAPVSQLANTSDNIIGADAQGGNSSSLAWSASQTGYVGQFYNANTGATGNGLAVKVSSSNASSGALDVSRGAVGTAGTSLLRVTGAGRVGIGTSDPQEELHVVGDARISSLGNGSSTRMVVAGSDGTLATQALPANPTTVAWSLTGNAGTAVATNFLGTTDNVPLAIKTNNTERLRVLTNGQVVVGGTSTSSGDVLAAYGTYAVNGYSTAANGSGVYANSTNATGFGMWGTNSNTSGTGVTGAGNNQSATTLTTGQGGAFSGSGTGVYAKASTASNAQAAYFDQAGNVTRVGYNNGTTQYKIQGTGTVSTIVQDPAGQWRTMFCAESPEYYFTDYGQGKLMNGRAHINLDPVLGQNIIISEEHPLRVFVQLEGECKGVYVTNKTSSGFDVVELNGGSSNTSFQWNIVCNVADQKLPNGRVSEFSDVRFQPVAPNLETIEIPARKTVAER